MREQRSAIGALKGAGASGYLLDGASNWVYRGLTEYLAEGGEIFRGTRAISTPEGDVAAGAFWLPGLSEEDARRLSSDFGLTLTALSGAPAPDGLAVVRAPRVAIYRSWRAPMPEGWTRWVLDEYGMDTDAVTLFARSQVLEPTVRRSGVSTPVCYPETDYLVSGWTLGGDEYLAGQTGHCPSRRLAPARCALRLHATLPRAAEEHVQAALQCVVGGGDRGIADGWRRGLWGESMRQRPPGAP